MKYSKALAIVILGSVSLSQQSCVQFENIKAEPYMNKVDPQANGVGLGFEVDSSIKNQCLQQGGLKQALATQPTSFPCFFKASIVVGMASGGDQAKKEKPVLSSVDIQVDCKTQAASLIGSHTYFVDLSGQKYYASKSDLSMLVNMTMGDSLQKKPYTLQASLDAFTPLYKLSFSVSNNCNNTMGTPGKSSKLGSCYMNVDAMYNYTGLLAVRLIYQMFQGKANSTGNKGSWNQEDLGSANSGAGAQWEGGNQGSWQSGQGNDPGSSQYHPCDETDSDQYQGKNGRRFLQAAKKGGKGGQGKGNKGGDHHGHPCDNQNGTTSTTGQAGEGQNTRENYSSSNQSATSMSTTEQSGTVKQKGLMQTFIKGMKSGEMVLSDASAFTLIGVVVFFATIMIVAIICAVCMYRKMQELEKKKDMRDGSQAEQSIGSPDVARSHGGFKQSPPAVFNPNEGRKSHRKDHYQVQELGEFADYSQKKFSRKNQGFQE